MNSLLHKLTPYPFERWRQLCQDIPAHSKLAPISLGIGEPKHPTPRFIQEAMAAHLHGLAFYPATAGEPGLRQALVQWVQRRYEVTLDPATQVVPVNGSREGLFSLAQAVVDVQGSHAVQPVVVSPNPFYQIYEGAALLAGAQVVYANCDPERNFAPRWDLIDEACWSRTQLLFVCSPGNPTGSVMSLAQWAEIFALSDRYGFIIASDECYSEIYFRDTPPLGGLQAAQLLGRSDFKNLVVLTSLSKRSNVPGLRSGFVAGDAQVLAQFLRYRTYHGCAMSPVVQQASQAAWGDENHVAENRAQYKEKFEQITPLLAQVMDVALPDAGFYLWADVRGCSPGMDDIRFARGLLAHYNVSVLPGSLLAREAHGVNPGSGRIRLALVASVSDGLEAAHRICDYVRNLPHLTQHLDAPLS